MRYLLLLLLISPAWGQSIIISGGHRSIVMSSRSKTVQKTVVKPHKVVTKTKVIATVPVVTVTRKPNYVVMFTSRSCGPCQTWKLNEMPRMIARGIHVREIEMSDPANSEWSSQVSRYPTFWVCDGETETRLESLVGFTSCDTLAARITSYRSPRLAENTVRT